MTKGQHMRMNRILTVGAALLVLSTGACGGNSEPKPAGPDVVGMNLPDAQKMLKSSGVSTTVHSDALFGVLVPQNYVVCKEKAVATHMVRLEVSKHSCSD